VPLGDGARLLYNTLVAPAFLERVPKTKEYPEMMAQLASRADPDGKLRKHFGSEDIRFLTGHLANMSPVDLADMLQSIDDVDLRVMSKLSRGRSIDERYRLTTDVLTGIWKVTETTHSGALGPVFDNSRLALNGDLSIKNTLALALGQRNITPKSGASLEGLLNNRGPASAWWQFLDFSIDLRAVFNTLSLVRNHDRADRELLRPFPHGPLMSDLAAYEVRGFGFPALIFHKRKLIKHDAGAYASDYAYGVIGTRIVEHFQDRRSFEDEIRAGRMAPLGFVSVADEDGQVRPSDLPVFGHRITEGKHAGKTSLILYGLKAFQYNSSLMEREHQRFRLFEAALVQGGVIEKALPGNESARLSSGELEPAIFAGERAIEERYLGLLHDLIEYDRYRRLQTWGETPGPDEFAALGVLAGKLRRSGVAVDAGGTPLLKIDSQNNQFVYLREVDGRPRKVAVTLIPSMVAMERDLRKSEAESSMESHRRELFQ
jgi:hypothetical protein